MSKKYGITSKVLGKPIENEDFVKYKTNCNNEAYAETPIGDIKHGVLFPKGKAVSENRVTLRGGCVVKLSLKKSIESSLDEEQQSKLIGFNKGSLEKVKNQFDIKIQNKSDFVKKVLLKSNKLLLNISEKSSEIEEMGNYYISGYKSYTGDPEVPNFTEFKIYLQGSRTRNKKIKRLFRFGYIPFEVVKSLVSQTAEYADGVGYNIFKDYSLSKLKEDLSSIDSATDQVKDDVLEKSLTYLFPVHKLSRDDAESCEDTVEQLGYYTYYNNSLYFSFPDMSLEDSQGNSPNFYNLGETKSTFRFYMAIEANLFGQINYSAVNYVPPPCPILTDNIIEDIQSSDSFVVDLSKDGLVGGISDHFGYNIDIPKYSDYNIVLSPRSSVSLTTSSPGIDSFANKAEYFTFPNQNFNNYLVSPDEDFLKIKEIFQNPSVQLQLKVLLGLKGFEDAFKVSGSFDDKKIKDFFIANGLPLFFSNSSLGFRNPLDYLGLIGRQEYVLADFETRPVKTSNDTKIYKKKFSSSNTALASLKRNYIEEGMIPDICINKNLSDLDPVTEQSINISEAETSKDSAKDFSIYFYASDFNKINIDVQRDYVGYIYDSYGQITRIPFGTMAMQRDKPSIESITPNGFKGSVAILSEDNIDLKITGDSLLNITTIRFYESPLSILPYASFNVGDSNVSVSKNTFGEFNFTIAGTYIDLVTANIGPLYVELINKNGLPSSMDDRSCIKLIAFAAELTAKEEEIDVGLFDLSEDSFSAAKSSKIPILMTGDPQNCAIINFKSKDKAFFATTINCYLSAEVGTQSEEEIIKIFNDFSFDEDIFVARDIDFEGGKKTFVITKSIEYKLRGSEFYPINKRRGKLIFPGESYLNHNLSNLDKLLKPAFMFFNRNIVEFGSNGYDLNISNMTKSYSILRLGTDIEPAFVKPPSIRNIIVQNKKDSKILTSNLLTDKVTRILSGENRKERVIFTKEKLSSAIIGTEIHVGKNVSKMVVIAEGYFSQRSVRDFKLSVGESNFGFGLFSGIKSLFEDSLVLAESFEITEDGAKKNIAIFVMTNVDLGADGVQNLVLTKKDRDFKTKYDSSLRKIETVTSFYFEEQDDGILYNGNIALLNNVGVFSKSSIPIKKEFFTNRYGLSTPISFLPSSDLGVFGVRFEQELYITNTKSFFENGGFYIYDKSGRLSQDDLSGLSSSGYFSDTDEIFSTLKESFSFSDAQFVNITFPEINLNTNDVESLAQSSLDLINSTAEIGIDSATDPLSSGVNKILNVVNNIEGAIDELSDESNDIIAFDNSSLYLVTSKTKFLNGRFISQNVLPIDYPDLEVPDGDSLTFKLFKAFLNIEVKDNASLKINMPRIISITKNNDEVYSAEELVNLRFEVDDILDIQFENLYDEDFKIEVNKKRVSPTDIKIDVDGTGSVKYTISEEVGKIDFSIFQDDAPCFEISFSSTNSLYFGATKAIGNGLAINLDERMDSLMNGSMLNDRKDQKDWSDLASKFPIKWSQYVADKSQTLLELRDSFCDLSFSITGQFSAYLSGFKNILVIIKVIFCIIDVICALLNPVKLAFATIRLFSCLYDLLLLLPQIAIPVALLTLILHLLELLKCVIEKILYIIRAINEISAALEEAILNKDIEAILNLEKVLSEYILDLETDIQVLDPIIDILNLFLELLQVFFAFPCSPGQGSSDEFRECQLDSSLVSGIILSKVTGESGDGLSKENLLPVAQGYTTLGFDDMYGSIQCGNTPPGTENDDLSWMGDCNYSGDVLREPKDYIGAVVANKNLESDGFLERTTVNSNSFRTSNYDANSQPSTFDQIDFEATYSVTYTKSTKNPSGFSETFIQGPDPRRVTFEFNSKGITNSMGYVPLLGLIFKKKIINENQAVDSPFMFLNKDDTLFKVASASEDGAGLYSPIDGFSGFLRGNAAEGFWPTPLTVEFEAGEGDSLKIWQRTFEDLPMFAIVDESFNVYFINENGIKVDPETGGIKSIEARVISTSSAAKKSFTKEEQEVVKDELTLGQQANYNWLISLPNAPEPSDSGFFDPFPDRIKEAHDITQAEVKSLAQTWGDWTDFETEYNAQVPFKTARDKDGVIQDCGAYDYAGGFIWDKTKLSNALDSIDVFDFPQLYFVDLRQIADELQSACTISDVNSILLGGTPSETVAENVTEVLKCVGEFKSFMETKISGLKQSVENGEVPGLIDVEEVQGKYTALVSCLTDSADKACNIVVNPYNTSFLLSGDVELNQTDYADPAELEGSNLQDVLEFAAGLSENFEGPNITGASEFASGLGSEYTAKIGEEIEIIIIPRDSYDNLVENVDFERKINIQIVSDTTGGAKIKPFLFEGDTVFAEKTEDGDGYRSVIYSNYPGKIKVKATICGKTIKAFTYSNVVQIYGDQEEDAGTDCVPDSSYTDQASEVSLGALVEVDRILEINIEDNDLFLGIERKNIEDVASEPQTSPQTRGTNLEN